MPPKTKTPKTVEERYKQLEDREHVLKRPDTYIGEINEIKDEMDIMKNIDDTDEGIIRKTINFIPGILKIFDEVILNALDHCVRTSTEENSLKRTDTIKVTIDRNGKVSVWNNGKGIDIKHHSVNNCYVPELIFNNLRAGENFDDDQKRVVGGRNGYGSKLTNIFSNTFSIHCICDGMSYKQTFSKNMTEKSKPVIREKKGLNTRDITQVTYEPDFSKFGDGKMTEYSDDFMALLYKRVFDISACAPSYCKVYLNGKILRIRKLSDYVASYIGNDAKAIPRVVEQCGKRWEVGVALSDDGLRHVSFANGINTYKGGTHVNYIVGQLTKAIKLNIENSRKSKGLIIKDSFIRNHLSIWVKALIENPTFSSQTKEELTIASSKWGSKPTLSEKFINDIVKKLDITNAVVRFAEFKENGNSKKTDGKKRRRVTVDKLDDAEYAGTAKSERCTLILTEGDSAKGLAMASLTKDMRKYFGVFPLKGKPLNVSNASTNSVNNNDEVKNIKKIIGLEQNKDYADLKSLRYGRIMIMTDQDVDGYHIKGLVITIFRTFWKFLFRHPTFISSFRTPIVKAVSQKKPKGKGKKKKTISFYTQQDFDSWMDDQKDHGRGWDIKYYKGLGTSTPKEGREYFADIDKNRVFYKYGKKAEKAFDLAFDDKHALQRKKWLKAYDREAILDTNDNTIAYEDFIHKELIHFSQDDLSRSVPGLDGLKPTQRKILYTAFKKNINKDIKVATLQGYVTQIAKYHHGEASCNSAIINMAQNFVGSNNINLLQPSGIFGSELTGGKDASSPRYIFTHLASITRTLFNEEDDPILEYLEDDGKQIEPLSYMPIVPVSIINGAAGIGTGFSTKIPNYNPKTIAEMFLQKLEPDEKKHNLKEPIPYYRGWKGEVICTSKKGASILTYDLLGTFKVDVEKATVYVKSLPIGLWITNFKKHLDKLCEKGITGKNSIPNVIKDYKDKSVMCEIDDDDIVAEREGTSYNIDFEIRFADKETFKKSYANKKGEVLQKHRVALIKLLKLSKRVTTSNMHLFNENGVITKYKNVCDIVNSYYPIRLNYYKKRMDYNMKKWTEEVKHLQNRYNFVKGIVDGTIVIQRKKRADVDIFLTQAKFDKKDQSYNYLLSMAMSSMTEEKLEELKHSYDSLKKRISDYKKETPSSLWKSELENFISLID